MKSEIFKEIIGYPNYQVSNLGNINSLKFGKEKLLKLSLCYNGYNRIGTINFNKKQKKFFIHRLVAIAFIPNPENKPCVNHINGIKTDNRVENLEWCTYSENLYHAIKTGLNNQAGINNKNSRFKIEDILYIRNSNLMCTELAKEYNVTKSTISKIKLFQTYK